MIFDADEALLIYAAVEEFLESGDKILFPPSANINDLCKSCLNKLDNQSVLTYFTRQEFTVMYVAFNNLVWRLDANGTIPDGFVELLDKIGTLADPDDDRNPSAKN